MVSPEPWTNQQKEFSINPESVISSSLELGTMEVIGYLPLNVPHHPSRAYKNEIHSFFGQKLRDSGLYYDHTAFARACTSHIAANKGVSKYGDDCTMDVGEFRVLDVLSDVLKFFDGEKEHSVPILQPPEVLVEPNTAPGKLWKERYRHHTKRIDKRFVIENHGDYVHNHWVHAHQQNYPEPWSSAVKEELLKMKKLVTYDHRCFIIGSTEFFFNKSRLNQAFNRKISSEWFSELPIKVGIDFTRGGFVHFLRDMVPSPEWDVLFAGDLTKWDARMALPLFVIALMVRYHCWDKKGMTVDEWFQRQCYYYWQTINSFIVTPAGQVLYKKLGNPSGDGNTTYDNCLGHLPMVCYMFRKITGRGLHELWNVTVRGGLYADDHLFSTRGIGAERLSYKIRAQIYREAGGLLKEEDDLVTTTPMGQTFLGLKAEWSAEYSCYVPLFNRTKAACSFEQPGKFLSHQVLLDRAIAISGLMTFDKECFQVMHSICVEFANENKRHLERSRIPPRYEWISFWLGQESVSSQELSSAVLQIPDLVSTEMENDVSLDLIDDS